MIVVFKIKSLIELYRYPKEGRRDDQNKRVNSDIQMDIQTYLKYLSPEQNVDLCLLQVPGGDLVGGAGSGKQGGCEAARGVVRGVLQTAGQVSYSRIRTPVLLY